MAQDEFIRVQVVYEDDSTAVLDRVVGADIFKDGDRPIHFISRCGKVCEPRKPTSEGVLHEYDTRKYI